MGWGGGYSGMGWDVAGNDVSPLKFFVDSINSSIHSNHQAVVLPR